MHLCIVYIAICIRQAVPTARIYCAPPWCWLVRVYMHGAHCCGSGATLCSQRDGIPRRRSADGHYCVPCNSTDYSTPCNSTASSSIGSRTIRRWCCILFAGNVALLQADPFFIRTMRWCEPSARDVGGAGAKAHGLPNRGWLCWCRIRFA